MLRARPRIHISSDVILLPTISRQTILVKMDTNRAPELAYQPGDHVGVFPANPEPLVDTLLTKLVDAPPGDQIVQTEVLESASTAGIPNLKKQN